MEPKPSARSGCQLFTHNNTIILYGGYCKKQEKKQESKGITHTDIWVLKMSSVVKEIKWERKKNSAAME